MLTIKAALRGLLRALKWLVRDPSTTEAEKAEDQIFRP